MPPIEIVWATSRTKGVSVYKDVLLGTKSFLFCSLITFNRLYTERSMLYLVGGEGLEPSNPCGHGILSPARLPVPPPARGSVTGILYNKV